MDEGHTDPIMRSLPVLLAAGSVGTGFLGWQIAGVFGALAGAVVGIVALTPVLIVVATVGFAGQFVHAELRVVDSNTVYGLDGDRVSDLTSQGFLHRDAVDLELAPGRRLGPFVLLRRGHICAWAGTGTTTLATPLEHGTMLVTADHPELAHPRRFAQVLPKAHAAQLIDAHENALAVLRLHGVGPTTGVDPRELFGRSERLEQAAVGGSDLWQRLAYVVQGSFWNRKTTLIEGDERLRAWIELVKSS